LCLETGERAFRVLVHPYILPPQLRFSSEEGHMAAAGPKRWNRQQGFYIYRGDRMIQSGGWNRLRTVDEHSKLARIAVDIPSGAEDLFGINVAKMAVALPDQLRPQLRALAAGVVSSAQEAYRQRLRLLASPETVDHPGTNGSTSSDSTLGDLWPLITDILRRELRQHPDLRDRVLVALANAQANLVSQRHMEKSKARRS